MAYKSKNEQLSKRLWPHFNKIYDLTDDNQVQVTEAFQILPPRSLTEYFKVIKRPMSLQKVKISLNQARYSSAEQFVNDLAQVCWNARFFNIKGSLIYTHAVILEHYIREKIVPALRGDSRIKGHERVTYPDLGPLPEDDAEPATPVKRGGTPFDEEDEEDEEDILLPRSSTPQAADEREKRHHWEAWIKRGRPPIIDKPHEQRIKTIMKGLKKIKAPNGDFVYLHYDKLPSPSYEPEFYKVVSDPIAFNEVRARIKQRVYQNVESFLTDVNQVLATYKKFYSEDPHVSRELRILEEGIGHLVAEELAKPESTYHADSSNMMRVPIDSVKVQGRTYTVGDWVLLRNPNDSNKPIIGQIFRLWSTPQDGNHMWMNVCWYYRPEQTVHRVDRLFYENEVFKSAQYRDHLVEDIVGPCYVAYYSKYKAGDPAFKIDGPFFICEYRYNDVDRAFNKIKTWKGCIPDVVRNREEAYTPINGPRNMQRVESPLRHMLRPNAKETDPIPEPTVGNLNAPPLIGGVYLRPASKDDEQGVYLHTMNGKSTARNSTASPAPPHSADSTSAQTYQSSYSYPAVSQSTQYAPSRVISSPYNQVQYPVNMYHSSTSSSLTISPEVEKELSFFAKSGIAKMDTANYIKRLKQFDPQMEVDVATADTKAPLIWLRGPPAVIADRLIAERPEALNKIKQGKMLNGDTEVSTALGGGYPGERLGHSMEYLKWKLEQSS